MQCPECSFKNRVDAKFCLECGKKLECQCPICEKSLPLEAKYCDDCGSPISSDISRTPKNKEDLDPIHFSQKGKPEQKTEPIESARKHVTALFSDLSGYTAMAERMDPEDVKDITAQLFDRISKVVRKYDGFVEKFVGDAVMALFGAKITHEDDPVRAIKAALEIHNEVNKLSPHYEETIEQPLSMHTGINTGMVVTGDINLEMGTHGVAGDTLNVAARLSGIGNSDEIIVGHNTYIQTEGYFEFDALEPANVKGKAELIRVYKVLSIKEQPQKVHRLQGIRANLIGRKVEIQQLNDGIKSLQNNKGQTISICGTAGTGKSRLIEDFKSSLDLTKIQWFEGYAYPYAQNIPYFPLINLLNQTFQIEEDDTTDKVKKKIESGLTSLVGDAKEWIPYVGSLYSLDSPEISEVSPEFWKSQIQKAIGVILAALAKRGPTIVCLEDLHWADPSFLELFRHLILGFRDNVLFLCIYRPTINLVSSRQIAAMINPYSEIQVRDLSPSESQDMVESLLQTEIIPAKLKEFIHNKVEGNPFYIEEVINSLIESKVLVQDNDGWQVFDEISNTELSSTINGVISSRLDHLEKESKRILQEASVIGRSFYYDIIKRITALNSDIDVHLSDLERLDFIKAKYFQQDIEYFFKHALTQEVVYNGLLKKERRSIHNKIGLVIEYLFKNRLAEFYETLAYHFTNGENVVKAVDYLIKSGEKSLQRYSLGEAHQYFNQAFDILQIAPQKIEGANEKIIDLLNKWSFVYYYTGEFRGHDKLLSSQKETASRVENDEIVGMYYAWNGLCLWTRNKYKESYEYLEKAKNIGETTRNPKVTGYAYTWLSWVCAELGLFDKGLEYGNIANKIARSRKADHYLYFKSLAGVAYNHLFIGSVKECINIGKKLIEYGNIHSQVRCLVLGYLAEGWGYLNAGDMILAGKAFKKSVEVSVDPFYLNLAKTGLATAHLSRQNFEEAEKEFNAVVNFCTTYGCENMNTFAEFGTGVICIGNGKMSKGMQIIEKAIQDFKDQDRMGSVSFYEFGLASLYLEMVKGTMPVNLLTILKNIGFICKNVPFAEKKAELHLKNSIRNSESIGAMGIVGQAYLGLGILHQLKKRNERAQNRFSSAIQIFKKTGAYIFLKQAKESLESLEQ